jgi:hypothetical protein
VRIGQRVRAVHLSQYCPGGLGFAAGSPGDPGSPGGPGWAGSQGLTMGAAHGADPAGAACARCTEEIMAGQPARRRLTGEWIHETCPPRPLPPTLTTGG